MYAAGAVPGEFLPGAQAAFLTSATMAALAGVAGLVALSAAGGPRTLVVAETEVEAWRLRPPEPRETV